MEALIEALGVISQPGSLLFLLLGVIAGMVVGATPGLTSTIAIGLLIPFTFTLTKYDAFILLLGIYCGSMYGGSIPAILMNLPGTPTSAVTAQDGYPMTRSGKAGYALAVSVVSSSLGGLFSCAVLIFLSIQLAFLATAFAGPEYFSLCLFALTVVFSTSGDSILKGVIATGFGLLIATVGLDPVAPYPRFTFGVMELMIGVPEVPATIGLFCVAEGLRLLTDPQRAASVKERVSSSARDVVPIIRRLWRTILKSSAIGTVIGILPGAGAMMASYIAYGEARRTSKESEMFGKGSAEGVSASESANNSVTGGALIPMLTLGIPGDVNTLMLLGAMLVHGLIPGPALFRDESSLVYVIFLTMICANILIMLIGLRFAPLIAKVTQFDQRYLVPAILLLAITGPAISSGHIYYFWVTILFGFIGFALDKGKYPVMATAMAIVLGPILEKNLRASLMLPDSTIEIFLSRPIAMLFIGLSVILLAVRIYKGFSRRRHPTS